MEADGAVDAQNAPTAPWKTLCVFHELPQGLSHQVTHEKLRKAPKYRWETRIDPDFRFFLSNIRLVGGSEEYRVPESFHLVRFDGDTEGYRIELNDVPRMPYTEIHFGIGVDEAANSSIESVGDLDPNSRMAWSWDVGYKFILLEGGLSLNDEVVPLVYHVGFNENYKPISVTLEAPLFDQRTESVVFEVDIMKIFRSANTIDMSTLSNVKFDRADARLVADNYERMITLCARPDC